jgi:hypothetical protein
MKHFSAVFALSLFVLLVGCVREPAKATYPTINSEALTETLPEGPGLRVLYLGNSLTFWNDLPAVVQAMAASGGVQLRYLTSTVPNANLEDQWNGGRARSILAKSKWDFVVMQQGPSSLPESQVDLKKWAPIWADEIRKHGAKPALFMVWPTKGQRNGFKLVSQSYRNAATAAQALIFPAGEAWEEALRVDPRLVLYSDTLHPSPAGTYLAALVITQGLTDVKPAAIPSRLKLASGQVFQLPDEQAAHLRRAAETILAKEKPKEPTN